MDSGSAQKRRYGAAWWSHTLTAFCTALHAVLWAGAPEASPGVLCKFLLLYIAARGWKYYSCLSGAWCLFQMFLIPVLGISQTINHLYNEFSSHLRYGRFWFSPEMFFLMYLSCGVTWIRSKITCPGIAWEVHCLRGLYQFKAVDILFYLESCFHLWIMAWKESFFREKYHGVCQIKDSHRSSL